MSTGKAKLREDGWLQRYKIRHGGATEHIIGNLEARFRFFNEHF